MRIAIVHNEIRPGENDPSTLDVLDQAAYVAECLAAAGHECERFAFTADVGGLAARLREWRPDRVFNLVEAVRGCARLHPSAAAFWELLGRPFTGSGSAALALTSDKARTKQVLRAGGIATPAWASYPEDPDPARLVPPPWILKPGCEDASVGIEEDSVVRRAEDLPAKLRELSARFPGQPILVEQYVEGREFNQSVLGTAGGPIALPPVEIRFDGYPPGKERVVGFRAKWVEDSFECEHTVRSFDFDDADAAITAAARETALRCWRLFDLHGYARVDMRVSADGVAYVIEINANPCLSAGAGFAAAVARADMSPARMIQHILEDAVCPPA